MRLFYSLIQLFDTCYSHFWSFFSPHFFLISRETNTFCWDFFFDDCQCTEIGRRVGCFVALASYTLSYLFNRFLWKYVKLKTSILHCTTCNRQQNEQMTNERIKNYEFSYKEFFPCRCIHWKSCLSNSFDTYECFENMFQQRMLYMYLHLHMTSSQNGYFICTCELDSLTQNIPFHSNAMKCPCAISKQSLVRSNRLLVKSKENNLSNKKFIHWHFLGK